MNEPDTPTEKLLDELWQLHQRSGPLLREERNILLLIAVDEFVEGTLKGVFDRLAKLEQRAAVCTYPSCDCGKEGVCKHEALVAGDGSAT